MTEDFPPQVIVGITGAPARCTACVHWSLLPNWEWKPTWYSAKPRRRP
jgi:hypothetical protein